MGLLNGTSVTAVKSVSRQGVETTGAVRSHRVGSPCIISDFATIQRVAAALNGSVDLDGSAPIGYDAEPTLADRKDLATVGYVLDTVTGGTVAFDSMTVAGSAGEAIVAGNLVYFKTSDQEWYKTDADTAATVEGVQLGIALGTGSDGVAITGGIQTMGTYTTTGLTAGALYYASNTAGAISSSAGTTARVIGIALSTTKFLIIPRNAQDIKDEQKDALAGGGDFGTPSTSNKFITQGYNSSATGLPVVRTYLNAASPATWTKPAGLKYVVVEVQAAGGGGAGYDTDGTDGPATSGSGGGYCKKLIAAASLGATETVTIGTNGTGGNSASTATSGTNGSNTTFGSHVTAGGGVGATANSSTIPAGGTATGGDLNIPGGSGSSSRDSTNSGLESHGGDSFLGKGSKVRVNQAVSGVGYGYGGAGGSDTPVNGQAGAPAIVVVTEYYS
jgi:hypothetical protein